MGLPWSGDYHNLGHGEIRSRGSGVMGLWSYGCVISGIFSAIYQRNDTSNRKTFLDVQQSYTDLFYHHAKFAGAREMRAARG